MSYKVAEFIGIMLGDGSIGHYACKAGDKIKSQHVVKVTLDSRNKEYAGYVGEIMKEVLGKYPVFYYKSNENTVDLRIFGEKFLNFVIWDIGLKLSPK